jgi:hypothetical protein
MDLVCLDFVHGESEADTEHFGMLDTSQRGCYSL